MESCWVHPCGWGETRGWLQGWCVLPRGSRVCIEKGGRRGFLFKMRTTPPQSKARPGWRTEMGMFEMHQDWWDPKPCSSRGWGAREAGAAPVPLCASAWGGCGWLASPK